MASRVNAEWWKPAVGWSLAALLVLVVAGVVIPRAALSGEHELLLAMASHTHLLNWAAGLMIVVGCIDSVLLYRRHHHTNR